MKLKHIFTGFVSLFTISFFIFLILEPNGDYIVTIEYEDESYYVYLEDTNSELVKFTLYNYPIQGTNLVNECVDIDSDPLTAYLEVIRNFKSYIIKRHKYEDALNSFKKNKVIDVIKQ